ncbi:MAG: 30S ribosomal protein S1 [Francisellaceae bacterium]|jgi:small subunit ribosomal protein S1|nr:30S ribosomal protein S1 [Francisellaceae bacterium]MBT6538970.1 30S ribosomal protein S1 [Francisellaceae bacterium]
MSESFAALLEQSQSDKLIPGAIVRGKIIDIDDEFVTVNAGLKSEGAIPKDQFFNIDGALEVEVGELVEVAIEALENGWGETRLSREKAKRQEAWNRLAKSFEANEIVMGLVSGRVKGGFTVEIDSIRAFLPGSLVDVRPVKDNYELEGKEVELKIIKLDKKRNNVVVSRRSVVEAENSVEREALLGNLQEGQVVKGIVKNLTDYGAFVDLGGVDGLLHITDMAWKRVKHPSEVVNVGQELSLKVLKFDREKTRVSLGLKQLGEDPWVDIKARYPESLRLQGIVTNVTDYGCFVEIEEGVEGLVHVSEMDWTNKNIHPSKVVQLGSEVNVQVLDIDEERRRISLGIKQCRENPWEVFAQAFSKGDKVSGAIKSITDFGIFIGLDGAIDGLVHLSDITWEEGNEQLLRKYKKGDVVEAMILAVDADRERISLGIKQLENDPFAHYLADNNKGSIVNGTVTEVNAKGATINLAEGIDGQLKATELSRDRVEDARTHLNVGDSVEAKVIGLDRKNRAILLSIKAKDVEDEREALKILKDSSDTSTSTKFGDLLKSQITPSASEE